MLGLGTQGMPPVIVYKSVLTTITWSCLIAYIETQSKRRRALQWQTGFLEAAPVRVPDWATSSAAPLLAVVDSCMLL